MLAFQFTTRIPVKVCLDVQTGDFARMAAFFPLTGLTCGAFSALLAWLGRLTGSALISSLLALLGGTLITGGLHVDGLADTFDGLLSARGRDRMLEIMSDSRIGVMGALAIFFGLLLKLALMYELMSKGQAYLPAVLCCPVLGKLALCAGGAVSVYAKTDGMGRDFIDGLNAWDFIRCAALTLLIAVVVLGWKFALLAIIAVSLWGAAAAKYVSRKLGGITGDVLGALNETGEMLFLLLAFALLA